MHHWASVLVASKQNLCIGPSTSLPVTVLNNTYTINILLRE